MKKPYDTQKYTTSNPVVRYLISNFRSSLLKAVSGLEIRSLIDAGCGEGYLLKFLMDNLSVDIGFSGIDISDDLIKLAGERVPGANVSKGSVYSSDLEEGSFDLVVCTEVLEHLEEPRKALEELFRISRQYVLLSVPNEPYFQLGSLLRGKYVATTGNHPGHINKWSKRAFLSMVSEFGEVIEYVSPFPWTIVLAKKRGEV